MQEEKSPVKKVVDLLEENGFHVCRVEEEIEKPSPVYPLKLISLLVKTKKRKLFFISKSSEEKSPVKKVVDLLEENGFRVCSAANVFLTGNESFTPSSNGYISLRLAPVKKE